MAGKLCRHENARQGLALAIHDRSRQPLAYRDEMKIRVMGRYVDLAKTG